MGYDQRALSLVDVAQALLDQPRPTRKPAVGPTLSAQDFSKNFPSCAASPGVKEIGTLTKFPVMSSYRQVERECAQRLPGHDPTMAHGHPVGDHANRRRRDHQRDE